MSDRNLSNESIQKWPTEISDRLQNPRCRATWWCPCVSAVAGGARRGRTGTGRARRKPAHGGRKRRRRCLQEERCLRHWTGLRESPALGRAMACGGDGALAPPRGTVFGIPSGRTVFQIPSTPWVPVDRRIRFLRSRSMSLFLFLSMNADRTHLSRIAGQSSAGQGPLLSHGVLAAAHRVAMVLRCSVGRRRRQGQQQLKNQRGHGGPRPGTPRSSSFLSMDLPGTEPARTRQRSCAGAGVRPGSCS